MNSQEKEKRPQGGHPETSSTENTNTSSDPVISIPGGSDYTLRAMVYKMTSQRMRRGPLQQEVGEAGKAIIREGVKLARAMDKTITPLPIEVTITPNGKTAFCGQRFELERDMTDTPLAHGIEKAMKEHGVGFVAILRNGWDSNVYVSYGRGDSPEYWACIHMPKAGE